MQYRDIERLTSGGRLIVEFTGRDQSHHQQHSEYHVNYRANNVSGKDRQNHVRKVKNDANNVNWNVPAPGEDAKKHENDRQHDDDAPNQAGVGPFQQAVDILGGAQTKDEAAGCAELIHHLVKDREKGNPEKVIGSIPCVLFKLSTFLKLAVLILGRLNAGVRVGHGASKSVFRFIIAVPLKRRQMECQPVGLDSSSWRLNSPRCHLSWQSAAHSHSPQTSASSPF